MAPDSLTKEGVRQTVLEITEQLLLLDDADIARVDPHQRDFLTALGGNSIDALELIITIEERFGIEFRDDEMNFDMVQTLDHFAEKILSKLEVA